MNMALKSFRGNVIFLEISEQEISGEKSAQMHVDIDVLILMTRGRLSTCLLLGVWRNVACLNAAKTKSEGGVYMAVYSEYHRLRL